MSANEKLHQIIDNLKTQRDELRVRVHLAKAEAREEWDEMERRWEHIEDRLERAGHEAKESAGDVSAALSQVAEEIGAAYKRIKKSLD